MKPFSGVAEVPDSLVHTNTKHIRMWRQRWWMQKGSRLFHANAYVDMRDAEQIRRYAVIESKRRLLRPIDHPINLSVERIRRRARK